MGRGKVYTGEKNIPAKKSEQREEACVPHFGGKPNTSLQTVGVCLVLRLCFCNNETVSVLTLKAMLSLFSVPTA